MPKQDEPREVAPMTFLTEPTPSVNPKAVHPTDPARRAVTHQYGDRDEVAEHEQDTPDSGAGDADQGAGNGDDLAL